MHSPPKILIVEDDFEIRALLAEVLQEAGYDVSGSESGEDAIRELNSACVAGIVTDIRLGAGLSGWEVARHARQQHPGVAVIYMTGDSASDWASKGVPTSIMVQKPFDFSQMALTVSKALYSSHSSVLQSIVSFDNTL